MFGASVRSARGCCCGLGELDAQRFFLARGAGGVPLGTSCHAPQGHRGAGETPTPVFPEGITASLGAKKILLVKSVQLQVKSKYDDFILVRAVSHTASL